MPDRCVFETPVTETPGAASSICNTEKNKTVKHEEEDTAWTSVLSGLHSRYYLIRVSIPTRREAQYNLKQGIRPIFPSSLHSITEMSLPLPQITDVTLH